MSSLRLGYPTGVSCFQRPTNLRANGTGGAVQQCVEADGRLAAPARCTEAWTRPPRAHSRTGARSLTQCSADRGGVIGTDMTATRDLAQGRDVTYVPFRGDSRCAPQGRGEQWLHRFSRIMLWTASLSSEADCRVHVGNFGRWRARHPEDAPGCALLWTPRSSARRWPRASRAARGRGRAMDLGSRCTTWCDTSELASRATIWPWSGQRVARARCALSPRPRPAARARDRRTSGCS
jgi:hypothetical protein